MHSTNLNEILIILAAAVVIVAVFRRLNLSPVLGYLVAGVAIGPYSLGLVTDIENAAAIAELGIVFLLFHVGLELTFDRLKSMRLHVFGFGTLQVVLCSLLIGFFAYYFGTDQKAAIIIGTGLALSSTAIVIKVLTERGEQATVVGRLALAVLILQDLAVVPLLVLVSIFGKGGDDLSEQIIEALIQGAVALVGIIILGRLLLRPIFRMIGGLRSQELFAAATLLILLGAAWLTEQAGLSLALGAFLAGLLIAETEYRHQVQADIMPYKSLLMGLFFMTVGMQLDVAILKEELLHIAILSVLIILTKLLIIVFLCLLFRFSFGPALNAGLLLAQGGEFAFILFGLASQTGVLPAPVAQLLMVTVTITMAITPLLATLGKNLQSRFNTEFKASDFGSPETETKDLENHVIVAGFGRVGKTICTLLAEENINYVSIDNDARRVHEGRNEGYPLYYGNAERPEVMSSIGIERANSIVIAIQDRRSCKEAVIAIRKMYPDLPIIARAWDRPNARELEAVGATKARAEAFESSLQLGKATLETVAVPEMEIERVIRKFRAEGYGQSSPILDSHSKIPE